MVRTVISLLIAGLLVVTSLAAGVARGQADPVTTVVICAGGAPTMVHLDANGEPTGAPVLCPDGVMGLFSAVAAPAQIGAPERREARLAPAIPARLADEARTVRPRARAPPAAA